MLSRQMNVTDSTSHFVTRPSPARLSNSRQTGRPTASRVSESNNARENTRSAVNSPVIQSTTTSATADENGSRPKSPHQNSFGDNMGIILDKPKFKRYATLDARLRTFNEWPTDNKKTPNELSRAGFAYTGTGDSVRCYNCGGGLRHWKENDCPWREHVRLYKHCAHVRQCKGYKYVEKIVNEQEKSSSIMNNNDKCNTCESFTILDDSSDLETAYDRNAIAIQSVKEFGEEEYKIKEAVRMLVSGNDERIFSAEELMASIISIQDQDILDSMVSEENETKNEDEATDTEEQSRESLEVEHTNLVDKILCKICLDEFACMITLPCGHMSTCPQCISALTTCAICRTEIKGTIRAFLSLSK